MPFLIIAKMALLKKYGSLANVFPPTIWWKAPLHFSKKENRIFKGDSGKLQAASIKPIQPCRRYSAQRCIPCSLQLEACSCISRNRLLSCFPSTLYIFQQHGKETTYDKRDCPPVKYFSLYGVPCPARSSQYWS